LTVEPFSRARPCVALAAAFLACFPAAALAWNAAGHRLIAAIAWNEMSPEAREEAGALLRRHPDYPRWLKRAGKKSADRGDRGDRHVFIEASTWPDDIRGDKRFYSAGKGPTTLVLPGFADMERRGDWHYVNIPLSGAFGGQPFSGRLDRQLPELARTLAQSRSPRARAYALPWLIHLAGDAHQPLHAGARVDAAGKRERSEHTRKLRNPFDPRKPLATPHVFWDDLPGPRLRGERPTPRPGHWPRCTPKSTVRRPAGAGSRKADNWRATTPIRRQAETPRKSPQRSTATARKSPAGASPRPASGSPACSTCRSPRKGA
jgi:hypothetical protein